MLLDLANAYPVMDTPLRYANDGSCSHTVGSDTMTSLFALLVSECNGEEWASIGNNLMLTVDALDDN